MILFPGLFGSLSTQVLSVVTGGLVLHIDAGNPGSYSGSGTNWVDLSGQAHTSTLVNGVTYTSNNSGFLNFDGSDDYVDINAVTNVFSSDFTVEGWIAPDITTETYKLIFETNGYRQVTGGFAIYQYGTYFRTWKYSSGSYVEMLTTTTGSLENGVWKNFTLTRSGSALSFYLNSNLSTTYSPDTQNYYSDNTTQKYNFGGGRTDFFFDGKIQSLKIYNRALIQQEVTQNFNAIKNRFGL
jgi:hypothetical protein